MLKLILIVAGALVAFGVLSVIVAALFYRYEGKKEEKRNGHS